MDTRIDPSPTRTDVTRTSSASRVTPSSDVPFRDMVARGTGALVRGAEAAILSLPGAPIVAAAVRPGGGGGGGAGGVTAAAVTGTAESPVGGTSGAAPSGEAGSVEQTLAQSQEFNLYYLQLQEQLSAENRSYTAMSNVLKARHDTVKNAIGNIR
jgi:hypothetical protein